MANLEAETNLYGAKDLSLFMSRVCDKTFSLINKETRTTNAGISRFAKTSKLPVEAQLEQKNRYSPLYKGCASSTHSHDVKPTSNRKQTFCSMNGSSLTPVARILSSLDIYNIQWQTKKKSKN